MKAPRTKNKQSQAIVQQQGGKGNLKRNPSKLANGRRSAGK